MRDEIWFGTAYGQYWNGETEPPRTETALKKRPDQHGADLIRFGKAPVLFTGQVTIFGSTRATIDLQCRRWQAEQGQVHTLYVTTGSTARGQWPQVELCLAQPLGKATRIINATNNMNWMQRLTLNFRQLQPQE